jgi:hypothetical protein
MRTVRAARIFQSRLATSLAAVTLLGVFTSNAAAQPPEQTTREAAIETVQAEKLPTLHPYVPSAEERLMNKVQTFLEGLTGAGIRSLTAPIQEADSPSAPGISDMSARTTSSTCAAATP